jgi:sugar (pentulose or hexulose) kinase
MDWRGLFPPLRPTRSVLGPVTKKVAATTGLDPQTEVAVGIHDSNASLLPYLISAPGAVSVVSSGTWTIIMSPGAAVSGLRAERDCLGNVDAFGRPVPTTRFMGGREFEVLMNNGPFEPVTDEDIAHVLVSDVTILPSFAGAVGPFPNRTGSWINGPDGLTPGKKLCAVSLYLALVTLTGLELAGMADDIVVEGPLAKNEVFCRALAAFCDKRVRPSSDATGTSFGAALLFEDKGSDGPALPEPVAALAHAGLADYAARWRARVDA